MEAEQPAKAGWGEAPRRPTPLQIGLWLVIVAGATAVAVLQRHLLQFGVMRDDGHYLLLARSLLGSAGYGLTFGPGPVELSHFPFGYPLILAPLAAGFPDRFDVLLIPSLAATAANCALLFWGWRWLSTRSYWWSLMIVAAYAWSPLVVGHARTAMAEPVFTFFVLLSVILLEQHFRQPDRLGVKLLLMAVVPWMMFIRTAGWFMLVSLAAYVLWAKRKQAGRVLLPMGLGIVLTAVVVAAVTSVEVRNLPRSITGYFVLFQPFVDPTARRGRGTRTMSPGVYWLHRNHRHVVRELREILLPLGGGETERALAARLGVPLPDFVPGYVLLVFVLTGLWRWVRKEGWNAFSAVAAGYLVILQFWNWGDTRILYPVLPQLQLALLLGVEGALGAGLRWLDRAGRWPWAQPAGVALAAAGLLAINGYKTLVTTDSRQHTGDVTRRTAWLSQNVPAEAVVLTEEPVVDYLYSKRHTVLSPDCDESQPDLAGWLDEHEVDYVLAAPQVVWETHYTLTYTVDMNCLVERLDALAADGQVRLVYTSEPDLIAVYQVP